MLERLVHFFTRREDMAETKTERKPSITMSPEITTLSYQAPRIYVKRNRQPNAIFRYEDDGASDPGPPPESDDLIGALQQALSRIGQKEGISDVVIEDFYNWLDYSSPEFPDFAQHHFAWVEMAVVRNGVPYFFGFDIFDFSYELWEDGKVQISTLYKRGEKPNLEVLALQTFYTPHDFAKISEELSPEELDQKNREFAAQHGISPTIKIGLIGLNTERDIDFESRLTSLLKEAPEITGVVEKYEQQYFQERKAYVLGELL